MPQLYITALSSQLIIQNIEHSHLYFICITILSDNVETTSVFKTVI